MNSKLPHATGTVVPEPFHQRLWVRLVVASLATLRLAQSSPLLASLAAIMLVGILMARHWES